jgi:hypothetical protein
VCIGWGQKRLTEQHKNGRFGIGLSRLQRFKKERNDLLDSITMGGGTRVFRFTPQTKRAAVR